MTAILHTWGQNLMLHPHLHCIVPGAGVDASDNLHAIDANGKFLFSVKAMSKVFRAKYMALLRKKMSIEKTLGNILFSKPWVVYAKRAFGHPKTVVEYLSRYTHKVAISNHRIVRVDEHTTTFTYKDYKQGGSRKLMTLDNKEFVRRFSRHILPHRYVRIWCYGILSSTWKRSRIAVVRNKLQLKKPATTTATLLHKCAVCKKGKMIIIEYFDKRGPPAAVTKTTIMKPTCRNLRSTATA
jgi:hypothetical protein